MSELTKMAAKQALESITLASDHFICAKDKALLQIDKLTDGKAELDINTSDNYHLAFGELQQCRKWLEALASDD